MRKGKGLNRRMKRANSISFFSNYSQMSAGQLLKKRKRKPVIGMSFKNGKLIKVRGDKQKNNEAISPNISSTDIPPEKTKEAPSEE